VGVPLSRSASRVPIVAFAAALLVLAAGFVWWQSRRIPVDEARRFLNEPIVVGDGAPPPPAERAPQTEVEQKFAAARASFAKGDYAAAAQEFSYVVEQDPRGPHAGEAQWNLTRSRLRSGDGAGALTALDGLLRQHADYIGEQAPALREGLDKMAAEDLVGAKADLERMIEEQPTSEMVPLAYALIARIHWTHGEPMEMIRSFARMLASVRDRVPAYSVLAKQLDRYADGDEGVSETFGKLADDGPEGFRDIYKYLEARSLLEHDKFQDTQKALEELRRRFPDGDFTHIVDLEHAWNLLRNGQPSDALEIFERLEKTDAPESKHAFDEFFDLRAELPLGIARCQLALGNFAAAVAAFERAIEQNPQSIYAVENALGLARAYEGLGQLDRATEVLRKIVADHPDEPNLWAIQQQLERVEERMAAANPNP
jgi:tetratricopeptide (TPR) repeat protein